MNVLSPESLKKESQMLQVTQLFLHGMSMQDIAENLGLEPHIVRRYLSKVKKRWKDAAIENIDEARKRELAKLDELERQYWISWEESKKGLYRKKTGSMKRKGSKESFLETAEDEIITSPGDPRFLDGIQKCIDKRAKLLGLDAPTQTDSNVTLTARVVNYDAAAKLSMEQRAALLVDMFKAEFGTLALPSPKEVVSDEPD